MFAGFTKTARRCAVVAVAALAATVALSVPASAHPRSGHSSGSGTSSLVTLLTKGGVGFDNNPYDYDITTAAVIAVLDAKPNSAVGVLAKGDVPLTAFVPTDQAFRKLVHDLTGTWVKSEADVFAAVAGLGIDTVETVLLYHVVPGSTITYRDALKANGAQLTTAQGGKITVKVRYCFLISLKDNDPDAANPWIVAPNLNQGNVQIAHGINRVLRPVNL